MTRLLKWTVVLFLLLSVTYASAELTFKDRNELLTALSRHVVVVEYTLKYDKGKPPEDMMIKYTCSGCGKTHTRRGGATYVEQRRPFETVGFLLDPRTVVTKDIATHSRFIEKITVSFGDKRTGARIVEYATDRDAVFLKLEKSLKGAEPIKFKGKETEVYWGLSGVQGNGSWTTSMFPLQAVVAVDSGGRGYISAVEDCLVLDEDGIPVTISMNPELPADGNWKMPPKKWDTISARKLETRLKGLENLAESAMVRVKLSFRSPKQKGGDMFSANRFRSWGGAAAPTTEAQAVGVCFDDGTALVLTHLDAKTTARLEKIAFLDSEGKEHEASFVATLKDYGAIVVKLEKPSFSSVVLSDKDVREFRNELLLKAQISVKGEERETHYGRARITSYQLSYDGDVYPTADSKGEASFLFTLDGALLVLPVGRRRSVAFRSERRYNSKQVIATPAQLLVKALSDLKANSDPNNRPLSEQQEDQLAWMGVVLQKMDAALARSYRVLSETKNGASGAIVAHVYPGSPAAEAGIEAGMLLLRIRVKDQPKPVDVMVDNEMSTSFRWEHLDRMPAEYLSRLPAPWPSIDNTFARMLTDLGLGTEYTAELVSEDGKHLKEMKVVASPAHYASAGKYKSEKLGMTVRNLTFEVRYYMHKETKDPGVVVSKVEPGTKAAITGVKPYELITHINGEPVVDVTAFEKLIASDKELTLSVTRMSDARQVRIKMTETKDAKPE